MVDPGGLQGVFTDGEKTEPGLEAEEEKDSVVTTGRAVPSFQKGPSKKSPAKPCPTRKG